MPVLADDDMVQHFDVEEVTSPDQIPRNLNVSLGRRWISAGVIVHENERTSGDCENWSEDMEWCDRTGIQASQRDQIMAQDTPASVQD